jgi:hypothetical protein
MTTWSHPIDWVIAAEAPPRLVDRALVKGVVLSVLLALGLTGLAGGAAYINHARRLADQRFARDVLDRGDAALAEGMCSNPARLADYYAPGSAALARAKGDWSRGLLPQCVAIGHDQLKVLRLNRQTGHLLVEANVYMNNRLVMRSREDWRRYHGQWRNYRVQIVSASAKPGGALL